LSRCRIAVAVVLLSLLALTGRASAWTLGFNDGWVQQDLWRTSTPADLAYEGATAVRFPFHWDSDAEFERLKTYVTRAHQDGLQVIITPYGYALPNRTKWLALMRRLARLYPNDPIEVYNEPNLKTYGALSADSYASLFRASYKAIRSVRGNSAPILAANTFIVPCNPTPGRTWEQRFADLTRDLNYVVSVHVYPGGCWDMTLTDPASVARIAWNAAKDAQPGRPLWVTEAGFSSGRGEDNQLFVLQNFISELRSLGADPIYVHRLYDLPLSYYNGDTWVGLWGVQRSDGTWKPIGEYLHNLPK
jgi:Cellulase (glycosyl hydrolase family 5)